MQVVGISSSYKNNLNLKSIFIQLTCGVKINISLHRLVSAMFENACALSIYALCCFPFSLENIRKINFSLNVGFWLEESFASVSIWCSGRVDQNQISSRFFECTGCRTFVAIECSSFSVPFLPATNYKEGFFPLDKVGKCLRDEKIDATLCRK